jgi:hypothetical protein
MQQKIITGNLIRSPESVRQFASSEAEFNNGAEFIRLHLINIRFLEALSVERKNTYFREKVMEYPPITEAEINDYLDDKHERGYFRMTAITLFIEMIPCISKLIRSNGKFSSDISEKFNVISAVNESIIYVLRNPGMEDLLKVKRAE